MSIRDIWRAARLRRRKAEEPTGPTLEEMADLERRIGRQAEEPATLREQLRQKEFANKIAAGELEGALHKHAITAAERVAWEHRAVAAEAEVKKLRGQGEDRAAQIQAVKP